MAIEIKQLLIKSNIKENDNDADMENNANMALDDGHAASADLKEEILSACRRMIAETINEKGLR